MKRMRVSDDASARPPLSDGVVAVLLGSWSAKPPARTAGDEEGVLELFQAREQGCVQLWRQHERFLRATAAGWGWQPEIELKNGRRLFAAEFFCLPQSQQAAYWQARGLEAAAAMAADDDEWDGTVAHEETP